MLWFRRGVASLLALVMLAALLVGVNAVAVNKTLGTSDNLKRWLAESSIYNNVVDSALTNAQVNSIKTGNDTSIPLDNDVVRQSAEAVFTADLIEGHVNNFIDGNYSWIQGKTPTPEFSINLEKAKQTFAERVGSEVQTRLATLPTCTPEQLSKFQIPLDPMTINCKPASLNPETEGARITEEIGSSDFLKKPVIDANTIGKDNDNKGDAYYKDLEALPSAYSFAQKLPGIAAILVILLGAGIIFIAPTKRRGIRKIASVFLVAGLFLVIMKVISFIVVSSVQERVLTKTFENRLQEGYTQLLEKIQASIAQADFQFGLAFIALALVAYIVLLATRNKSRKEKGSQDKPEKAKKDNNSSQPKNPAATQMKSLPPDFYDDFEDDNLTSLAPPTPEPLPRPEAQVPTARAAAPMTPVHQREALTPAPEVNRPAPRPLPRPAQEDDTPLHRPPLSATTAPTLRLKKKAAPPPKKRPPRFVQ